MHKTAYTKAPFKNIAKLIIKEYAKSSALEYKS